MRSPCRRVYFLRAIAGLAALVGGAACLVRAQTADTWTSATNATFNNAAAWSGGAPVDDTTTTLASFDGTGTGALLTASQGVAGLSFTGNGYTLSSNIVSVLTLGTSGLTNTAASTTVSAPLAGAGGVTTTGASASLTLSGANSYSGGTTVNSGTLGLNNAAALGTGRLTINGGTIANASSFGLTLSTNNAQSWNASFATTGIGLNLGTGAVTLGTNVTVTTLGSSLTVGGAIGDGGHGYSLTIPASSGLVLAGANTYSGGTTLGDFAVLGLNNAAALGTGPLTIGASGLVNTSGSAITLSTNNPITLNGTLTFSGTSDLNLGASAVTLTANRVISVEQNTLTIGGAIGDGGNGYSLSKANSTGTLVLSGANTYTGFTRVNGGMLQFATENSLYNNTPASWTAANIRVASGATLGLNVGGAGEFTTSDVATLLASLTTVNNNGLLSGARLGFDTTNASGGTFALSAAITNSTGTGSGAVSVIKLGPNTLALAGANTYTGPTTISAGTLQVGAGGTTGSIAGASIVNNGALIFNRSDASAYSGVVSGTGSLSTAGTGKLTLSGANTYTGATTVSAGTLNVTGSIASGSTVTVATGGAINGTGTIGSATTIQSGGTLASGGGSNLLNFGSDLTLNNGSTSVFSINGTARGSTYDAVNVAGLTTFGGTLTLNIGLILTDGTSLNLFSLSGGSAGGFFGIAGNGIYAGLSSRNGGVLTLLTSSGQTLTFNENTGDLLVTGNASVPEPATYAAIAGTAMLGLTIVRRRRKDV